MNPSTALATVLVAALRELGVRHAVLSPGSRSSALAYALAAADTGAGVAADTGAGATGTGNAAAGSADPLQLHVRIDERAAGFLALGLAKETGVPAVVVTTSGTAVANLHPAVLEASYAGVPLIVLSADRPHALRGVGANQTADQVKLFGTAVRMFAEIPAPAGDGPPGGDTAGDGWAGQAVSWRATMSRAVAASLGRPAGDPGPVHVNVGFAEPLVPDDDSRTPAWLAGLAGITEVTAPTQEPVPLADVERTVVLAGDGAGVAAARLARARGWPLLAEPSSGARVDGAIGCYRLLLDLPELGGRIRRVVVLGRPTLSRPVARLLARPDVEVVVVAARPTWPDPAGRAVRVIPAVVGATAVGDPGGAEAADGQPVRDEGQPASRTAHGGSGSAWWRDWHRAGVAADSALDAVLDREAAAGRMSGALIAREVAAALSPGEALVTGPSTAVRDLDLAMHPRPQRDGVTVLANRGLAGIDGVVSTASGVALARAEQGRQLPVRVLVGDLTFLHDANGLVSGPAERRPAVQVIVLDDGGGGIFGLLEPGEVATRDAAAATVYERVFGTPTGTDLAALCAAHGVTYQDLSTDGGGTPLSRLRAALAAPPPGLSVLRVGLDRAARRPFADRVAATVRAAVDRAGSADPAEDTARTGPQPVPAASLPPVSRR